MNRWLENYFMKTLNFEDEIYMSGMGEARSKFLAILHNTIMKKVADKI